MVYLRHLLKWIEQNVFNWVWLETAKTAIYQTSCYA